MVYEFVSDVNWELIVKWHISLFIKIGFNLQVHWESVLYDMRVWGILQVRTL